MAPDINSLPASPRSAQPTTSPSLSNAAPRRTSQPMPPPPLPLPATNPSPAAYPTNAYRSPVMANNELHGEPMRHPRPLTAAELYLECEKEQEAVVNRLTRELTALRAQSASVASNASHSSNSTSASLLPVDISDPNPTHQIIGATHPTPSRRHRSSSSVSTRSIPHTPSTVSTTTNTSTQAHAGSTTSTSHNTQSQASADRAAAAGGAGSSRPPSFSASASGTSTPARQSIDLSRQTPYSLALPSRPSISRDASYSSITAQQGTPAAPTHHITSPHYIDTANYRSELESVKAENENLRQRVRALEMALRARRRDSSNSDVSRPSRPRDNSGTSAIASPPYVTTPPESGRTAFIPTGVAAWAAADGGVGGVAPPRERSESQSTTASSRRGMAGAEDEVKLGESAGSVGIGRGS